MRAVDLELDPTRDAYVYAVLGPVLDPLGAKVASTVALTIAGVDVRLSARRNERGVPYYVGVIPAFTLWHCQSSATDPPAGEQQITIAASDASAHLAGLRPSGQEGYQLDGDPGSPVVVEPDSLLFREGTYQPSADAHHRIKVAAGSWHVGFGSEPGLPSQLPGPAEIVVPVSRPGVAPAGYLMCVRRKPEVYLGVRTTITVPADCLGQWRMGDPAWAEGASPPGLERPIVGLESPNAPESAIIVRSTQRTTRGRYTVVATYTVGSLSRQMSIGVTVTE